jgi:hypothetical protein
MIVWRQARGAGVIQGGKGLIQNQKSPALILYNQTGHYTKRGIRKRGRVRLDAKLSPLFFA